MLCRGSHSDEGIQALSGPCGAWGQGLTPTDPPFSQPAAGFCPKSHKSVTAFDTEDHSFPLETFFGLLFTMLLTFLLCPCPGFLLAPGIILTSSEVSFISQRSTILLPWTSFPIRQGAEACTQEALHEIWGLEKRTGMSRS